MGVLPAVRRIGKYEVIDVIGTGGMGIVFRAHDPGIGRTVAIKMLKDMEGTSAGNLFGRFFSREMKSTGNLNHRNIVTVYDSGEHEGNPYLVMEYLPGEPLSKQIAERKPISLIEKLGLLSQVCDGLQYAHDREIIHRDIKPANIIILADGTAKIVDFGVARIGGGESSLVGAGQLVGSLSYMSPEQINSVRIDARTDIFSTGVVLYELLTYELPFRGADVGSTFVKILREDPAPLSDLVPDLPADLQMIVSRALAKQPNNRYQSAAELGFDLVALQGNLKRETARECMKRVEAALERGELDRARDQLLEVIRLDRQHERANLLLRDVRKAIQQQQRASQVIQMRSQAQVALAGAQFKEALACADEALTLDPDDPISIELRAEIQERISNSEAVRDAVNKAEAAFFAGDLEHAKDVLDAALRLAPSDSEARALASLLQKELEERSRRQQVQLYVDQARRGIADRNFSDALDALRRAEQIDAADSNVRELLRWAERGYEQEKRQRSLQEITDQIEKALQAGDFSSALTICEIGIQKFPETPTLLRLRAMSQKQREIADRRSFVQEKALAAKLLTEQEKLPEAVAVLTGALQRYPAEPNLESLLAAVTTELENQNREREAAAKVKALKRKEAEHKAELSQQLLSRSAEIRRLLDADADLEEVAAQSTPLRSLLLDKQFDLPEQKLATAVLSDVESKLQEREQLLLEVNQIREVLEQPQSTAFLNQSDARIQSIQQACPHDARLQHVCRELVGKVGELRDNLERKIAELSELSHEVDRAPVHDLGSIRNRASAIGAGLEEDSRIRPLIQRIDLSRSARIEQHSRRRDEMEVLAANIPKARSFDELADTVGSARRVAAAEPEDTDLREQLTAIETAARAFSANCASLVAQMHALMVKSQETATGEEAGQLIARARKIAGACPQFEELQEGVATVIAAIQERRRERDLLVEELTRLRSSIALLPSDKELHATFARAAECRRTHPAEGSIQALCIKIQEEVQTVLQTRAEESNRRIECDKAMKAASQLEQYGDWEGALHLLERVELKNPDRADLQDQILQVRTAISNALREQEAARRRQANQEQIARDESRRAAFVEPADQTAPEANPGTKAAGAERTAVDPVSEALRLPTALPSDSQHLANSNRTPELAESRAHEKARAEEEEEKTAARHYIRNNAVPVGAPGGQPQSTPAVAASAGQKSRHPSVAKRDRMIGFAAAFAAILLATASLLLRKSSHIINTVPLRFLKDPADSTLFIDRQRQSCSANCEIPLSIGSHHLVAEKSGYKRQEWTISVAGVRDADRPVRLTLLPEEVATPGTASFAVVNELTGAALSLDGRLLGNPAQHSTTLDQLTSGDHELSVFQNGRRLIVALRVGPQGALEIQRVTGMEQYALVAAIRSGREVRAYCRCGDARLLLNGETATPSSPSRYTFAAPDKTPYRLTLKRKSQLQSIDIEGGVSNHAVLWINAPTSGSPESKPGVITPTGHSNTIVASGPGAAPQATPPPLPPKPQPRPDSVATGEPAPPAVAPDADQMAWDKVKDSHDVNALGAFRNRYPNSSHARAALEEMESASWSSIKDSQQLSDLQHFLESYGGGAHSAEAKRKLAALEAKSQTLQPQVHQPSARGADLHEKESVLHALDVYRAAYEKKDMNALGAIWVTMPRQQLLTAFRNADTVHVSLTPSAPVLDGDRASVSCRQHLEFMVHGSKATDDGIIVFLLQKHQGSWLIESAK